jgi:hypothetical protein
MILGAKRQANGNVRLIRPNNGMCLQATVTLRAPGVNPEIVKVRENAVLVVGDNALFKLLDLLGRRVFHFQGVRHGLQVDFGHETLVSLNTGCQRKLK